MKKVKKIETRKEIMGYNISNIWTAETLAYKFYDTVQMFDLKEIIKKNRFSMESVESVDYDEEELFIHIVIDPTIDTESWDVCDVRGE